MVERSVVERLGGERFGSPQLGRVSLPRIHLVYDSLHALTAARIVVHAGNGGYVYAEVCGVAALHHCDDQQRRRKRLHGNNALCIKNS